jgi:hypothetical protein
VSKYKPGYSEKHSPFYDAGLADGLADAERKAKKEMPIGPDPDKSWSAMYLRGYRAGAG